MEMADRFRRMGETKQQAAARLQRDLRRELLPPQRELRRETSRKEFSELLKILTDPEKPLDDIDHLEWFRLLIAGGKPFEEFSGDVREFDDATACGLVWTANFVAYRCRTCGITPCMSICAECFHGGNHEGHDFNMFRSLAGGACDCGDPSVMKPGGYCKRHGGEQPQRKEPPAGLLLMAREIIPSLLTRLLLHMRLNYIQKNRSRNGDIFLTAMREADPFLDLLHDLCKMGGAMRHVLTKALMDKDQYSKVLEDVQTQHGWKNRSQEMYYHALNSLPSPKQHVVIGATTYPGMTKNLNHTTLLEELIFWTVIYRFPQKMVTFLLNMLPDNDYKDLFTQTFVQHYGCIAMSLSEERTPNLLANRVVHISVQLFSNEDLALRMVDEMQLLEILIKCALNQVMKTAMTCPMSGSEGKSRNKHQVVNCDNQILKGQCYWPIISDLTNIISHRTVAERFFGSQDLMALWARFLRYFMGMNLNVRELSQHVEFESNAYSTAFSAEIEACSAPMWQMAIHCKDPSDSAFTLAMLGVCLKELCHWVSDCQLPMELHPLHVSFHLPLLRYFTIFLSQAINIQGVEFEKIKLDKELLTRLMMFPLQIQAKLSEIFCGMWVRNGVQMKCQAMTYLQCHFCASMGDLDLYFLQVCASLLEPDFIIKTILKRFQITDWLSMDPAKSSSFLEPDRIMPMVEGALYHIAMLVSIRTHLGMSETELMREEMVTLLCMQDRTHSHLLDKIPEKTGIVNTNSNFDDLLKEVADYRDPLTEQDEVQQGQYSPKASVWQNEFDPLRTMLRSMQRKDFQSAIDRYNDHLKQSQSYKGTTHPWPPFQPLKPIRPVYRELRRILHSRTLHAAIFSIIYKAVQGKNVSDSVLCLCVALLRLGLQCVDELQVPTAGPACQCTPVDTDLSSWFSASSLIANMAQTIPCIKVTPRLSSRLPKESKRDYLVDADSLLLQILNQELSTTLGDAPTGALVEALTQQHNDIEMMEEDYEGNDDEDDDTDVEYEMSDVLDMPEAAGEGHSLSDNEVLLNEGGQSVHSAIEFVMEQVIEQGLVQTAQDGDVQDSHVQDKSVPSTSSSGESFNVTVGESLVSLLVKLHSKLSGKEGSYLPVSKISGGRTGKEIYGSGPYYIQSLLDQICEVDQHGLSAVEVVCHRQDQELAQSKSKSSLNSAAERRRKAQEAQKKLFAKFASQQMKFLEQTLEKEVIAGDDDENMVHEDTDSSQRSSASASMVSDKQYDCVICGQTSLSTETKPIGLVVLLQSTNVLGHRCLKDQRTLLPIRDEANLTSVGRCWREEMQRWTTIKDKFGKEASWEAVSMGWEGGVHMQTCGHALHLDCHKAYLNSLRGHQYQAHDLDVRKRGEFQCPLCRQLANSVLPFVPLKPKKPSSLERRKTLLMRVAYLLNIGKKPQAESEMSPQQDAAIKTFIHDMWRENECDELEEMRSDPHGLLPSICAIARLNLELEIVSAGGTLSGEPTAAQKRSCIRPLLWILDIHARGISRRPDIFKMWNKLINGSGVSSSSSSSLSSSSLSSSSSSSSSSSMENEMPLMVCDPAALLLLLVFSIPQPIDRAIFQCVITSVYNLVYIQALAALSCRLPESERRAWQISGKPLQSEKQEKEVSLAWVLSDVITRLSSTNLYQHADFVSSTALQLYQAVWSPQTVEGVLQHHCLPWLRLSSLLQHYLFEEDLPACEDAEQEFVSLARFLCLMDVDAVQSATHGLVSAQCFQPPPRRDPSSVVAALCKPLCDFIQKNHSVAKDLLMASPSFSLPHLLQLPTDYNSVFQRYNQQICTGCKKRPDRPLVCLVCGKLICWGTDCCKGQLNASDVGEGITHAVYCGKGTAIYLDINSSATLLIRGKRKCTWASLYLDSHGEEDVDLRRGKPLFLCKQRHDLLERLWRCHALDHNCKRWDWHYGGLNRGRGFPQALFI